MDLNELQQIEDFNFSIYELKLERRKVIFSQMSVYKKISDEVQLRCVKLHI